MGLISLQLLYIVRTRISVIFSVFHLYSLKKSIFKDITVPDSITEWSIYGLAQCCASGFCVSDPVQLTVFTPLFLECHLPYSFKRQEQVSVACSAYNYNNYPQRVFLKYINGLGVILLNAIMYFGR